jgi:hypothetical protein
MDLYDVLQGNFFTFLNGASTYHNAMDLYDLLQGKCFTFFCGASTYHNAMDLYDLLQGKFFTFFMGIKTISILTAPSAMRIQSAHAFFVNIIFSLLNLFLNI